MYRSPHVAKCPRCVIRLVQGTEPEPFHNQEKVDEASRLYTTHDARPQCELAETHPEFYSWDVGGAVAMLVEEGLGLPTALTEQESNAKHKKVGPAVASVYKGPLKSNCAAHI